MSLLPKSPIPPGMASMLKMFGVDPAEIMKGVNAVTTGVQEIATRLETLQKQNEKIIAQNAEILAKLEGRERENDGGGIHAVAASRTNGH